MEIEDEIYVFENCGREEGSDDEGIHAHTRWSVSDRVFHLMFFKIRDQPGILSLCFFALFDIVWLLVWVAKVSSVTEGVGHICWDKTTGVGAENPSNPVCAP